mmetsp:Transcript_33031/g.68974  ORF Transcript_33031/g.68974 Transcript_33031/m.68974 type:complete len:93 (-) Transcript_33031:75-353(-)
MDRCHLQSNKLEEERWVLPLQLQLQLDTAARRTYKMLCGHSTCSFGSLYCKKTPRCIENSDTIYLVLFHNFDMVLLDSCCDRFMFALNQNTT